MPWVTLDLDRSLPERVADTLALIPGVTLAGRKVTCARNARGVVVGLIGDAAKITRETDSGSKIDTSAAFDRVVERTRAGTEETLFPHQLDGLAFALEREAAVFLWGCGSGKTRAAALWSLAGKGPTIVVTKASVRRQFAREIERVANVRTKVLSPEGEKLAPGVWREWDADSVKEALAEGVTHFVTSWEVLPRFKDLIVKHIKPESMVLDECIPAGGLVSTSGGPRRIEDIRVGDEITSYSKTAGIKQNKVLRVWARPRQQKRLARVSFTTLKGGETGSFFCTEEHRVWTETEGYVPAAELHEAHHLRIVREGEGCTCQRKKPAPGAHSALLQPLVFVTAPRHDTRGEGTRAEVGAALYCPERQPVQAEVGGGSCLPRENDAADAREQPDAQCRDSCEGQRSKSGTAIPHGPRRQRSAVTATAAGVANVLSRSGSRVRHRDSSRFTCEVSNTDELQSGSRFSRFAAGSRGGRVLSQHAVGANAGHEEECGSVCARVDRVEVLEHGDPREPENCRGENSLVYDIEVEHDHNFFVNGALVSNCHVAKSRRRFTATLDDDGKTRFEKRENIATAGLDVARACRRRLGLTATFIANRTEDGWAQLDLLEPGQWGAFYARERNGVLVPGYASRYCNQRKGAWGEIDTKGASNLDELAERLATLTHYVSDAEALKSLPPMRREVLYLDASEQNRTEDFSREINAAMKEGAARLQEVLLCEAASRKRQWALDRAETALEAGQKVVLLTGRHKDCALLAKAAAKVAKKTGAVVFEAPGSLSVTARESIRDQYRDTTSPALLIGTREAWSTGIDGLQCTALVINLMLPWTLERVQQTEGRFRRPGMTASVTIVYPICTGTYDERVARLLLDKLPAVEKLNQSDLMAQFGAQLAGDEKELLESLVSKITGAQEDVAAWGMDR